MGMCGEFLGEYLQLCCKVSFYARISRYTKSVEGIRAYNLDYASLLEHVSLRPFVYLLIILLDTIANGDIEVNPSSP